MWLIGKSRRSKWMQNTGDKNGKIKMIFMLFLLVRVHQG